MTEVYQQIDRRRGVDHIGVGCIFFCHDGQGHVLLHKRSQKCRDEQGRWDCGAGALEFGESFEDAVRREVMEEYCVAPLKMECITVKNTVRHNKGTPTHWIHGFYVVQVDPSRVKIGDPDKMDEIGWFPFDTIPDPSHSNLPEELELVQTYFAKKQDRPRVGVAVIVRRGDHVLMSQRHGDHGEGTWCFPGGHLEFGEDWETGAWRETMEEVGIDVSDLRFVGATNDVYESEGKHYITLFMLALRRSGEPRLCEPHKFACDWEWFDWSAMPEPLFLPIRNLRAQGFDPRKM